MVELSEHLRRAVRRRWARASEQEKKEAASKASRAYWDSLTPEERSSEMKRRAGYVNLTEPSGEKIVTRTHGCVVYPGESRSIWGWANCSVRTQMAPSGKGTQEPHVCPRCKTPCWNTPRKAAKKDYFDQLCSAQIVNAGNRIQFWRACRSASVSPRAFRERPALTIRIAHSHNKECEPTKTDGLLY